MNTDVQDVLTEWIYRNVPGLVSPARLTRIGAGQSNLTYLVEDAQGVRRVLRTPPPGRHAPTAHDMHREARILRALAPTAVPVPAVIATGSLPASFDGGAAAGHTDASAGQEVRFYLMEHVEGDVLVDEQDVAGMSETERVGLAENLIEVLATLHRIDPPQVGLAALGPPEDYLARQVRRWERHWPLWGGDAGAVHRGWQACHQLVVGRMPPQQRVSIVHGDYRLSNTVVRAANVAAVLDWELCSLGDPLADLAWLLDDWRESDEPRTAMPSPTRAGGFPHRIALADQYARLTGLDLSDLDYYRGFTHWRAATLLQGVLTRRRAGEMGDHGAITPSELEETIDSFITGAHQLLT